MRTEEFQAKQAAMSNLELALRAETEIQAVCKNGMASFTMSIPPQVTNTDMIFCELIRRFRTLTGNEVTANPEIPGGKGSEK